MDFKKFFIRSSIVVVILILLTIILFFINQYFAKDFLSAAIVKTVLAFLLIGWFALLVVYFVIRERKAKPTEIKMFKKEDFVEPQRAKELWALNKSKRGGIPIINSNYKKSAFNFYNAQEPYPRGKEWFFKFQCFVNEGNNPGLYTITTSISRGEQWILGEGFRERECSYDDFKIPRDMPLYVTEDPRERLLETLAETHPERAIQLQERMIERKIMPRPPLTEPTAEEGERPPVVVRPYRRPYRYRRPYY